MTIHATDQSFRDEGRIVQQMLVLGLVDRAMKLPQRDAFDYLVRTKADGLELHLEIKVFEELSTKWECVLLAAEKYDRARELMTEGHHCRVVAQYLDACICFQFTKIPLPVFPSSKFRPDRPNGRTVMMPKLYGTVLWLGTIVDHQARIGVAI